MARPRLFKKKKKKKIRLDLDDLDFIYSGVDNVGGYKRNARNNFSCLLQIWAPAKNG